MISKLTFVDLLRRLQGRRPEEADLPASPPPPKETKDDLQAWRQSLFQRAPGPEPKRPRPVPTTPSVEEAPFETDEIAAADPAPVVEGPFGASREAAAPTAARDVERLEIVDEIDEVAEPLEEDAAADVAEPAPVAAASAPPAVVGDGDALREAEARWEARLSELTERLDRALANATQGAEQAAAGLSARLDALAAEATEAAASRVEVENRLSAAEERHTAFADERSAVSARLEKAEQRVGAGFDRLEAQERRLEAMDGTVGAASHRAEALEKALEAQEKHVRALEDDVGMALTELTERLERLQQQAAALGAALEGLQGALEEKTHQGRREAEDIRTQLAPLLEAHGARHAADERLLTEIDRLRESFADALAGLSDQLRRAVRGV